MKNWRAQIGTICPGPTITVENDFNNYVPEGVGVCTIHIPWGIPGGGPTPENLKLMSAGLEDGCRGFIEPREKQDVVIFACTSGSLIGGPNYDKECIEVIEKATGSKGLTTSTAIMQAFKALDVHRLAVLTPYPEATNEAEKIFLEKNGFEVTTIVDMNPERRFIPTIDPTEVYRHAKRLDKTGADALFVSCTALNCLDVIKYMEEDFALPVITSNQATIWAGLRLAGVGTKRDDLGKLWTL